MEYNRTDYVEMAPDVYYGDNCDEIRNRWVVSTRCGKEDLGETLSLDADEFPAGTRIVIEIPECPDCGQDAEFADAAQICPCGFDWNEWALGEYS